MVLAAGDQAKDLLLAAIRQEKEEFQASLSQFTQALEATKSSPSSTPEQLSAFTQALEAVESLKASQDPLVVDRLLNAGADLEAKDFQDLSVIEVAKELLAVDRTGKSRQGYGYPSQASKTAIASKIKAIL
jgi:hypothetical protein